MHFHTFLIISRQIHQFQSYSITISKSLFLFTCLFPYLLSLATYDPRNFSLCFVFWMSLEYFIRNKLYWVAFPELHKSENMFLYIRILYHHWYKILVLYHCPWGLWLISFTSQNDSLTSLLLGWSLSLLNRERIITYYVPGVSLKCCCFWKV